MAKKISLFSAIKGHILDTILGPKYYFVLMRYPNIHVRPDDATQQPKCLYETSSNIFFSEDGAREYLRKFLSTDPSEYLVTVEIHSFRSHQPIPHWNKFYDMEHTEKGYKTKLM